MSNKTTFAEIKATMKRNKIEYEMKQEVKKAYEREENRINIIHNCKPPMNFEDLYKNRPPNLISFRSDGIVRIS